MVDHTVTREWRCQHGNIRRGYATPTAHCKDLTGDHCDWQEIEVAEVGEMTKCGHTAQGALGNTFVCDLRVDHKGWHQQTNQLRNGPEHTNWGDDGLSIYASKDEARRKGN